MVQSDMMSEYVRQLLDLDRASLDKTLESLSRYAETRASEDVSTPPGLDVMVKNVDADSFQSNGSSSTSLDSFPAKGSSQAGSDSDRVDDFDAASLAHYADVTSTGLDVTPTDLAVADYFLTHGEWSHQASMRGWDSDMQAELRPMASASMYTEPAATCASDAAVGRAISDLTMSLPPDTAAAARGVLTSAMCEYDMPTKGAGNPNERGLGSLIQGLQTILEKQQQESAQKLISMMQSNIAGAPGLLAPPTMAATAMGPMHVQPTTLPVIEPTVEPPSPDWLSPATLANCPWVVHEDEDNWNQGAWYAESKRKDDGRWNQDTWCGGSRPKDAWHAESKRQDGKWKQDAWYGESGSIPTSPSCNTLPEARNASTPTSDGVASPTRRVHFSVQENNQAAKQSARKRKVVKPEICEETIRTHLRWLQDVSPTRVFLVRKINRLGFTSPKVLEEYFCRYGTVERVLVSHSRVKSVQPSNGQAFSRLRPSGVGFVVMSRCEAVEAILAAGAEQLVAGFQISVQKFERRSVEDSLPNSDDVSGHTDADSQ